MLRIFASPGLVLGLFLVVASFRGGPAQAAAPPRGQKVFMEFKCNQCHAIASLGIKATETEEEAPDLSEVGSKHDAKWIKKYLLKKASVDGRKHEKKFRGKKADLEAVSEWLVSLKKK